MIYITYDTNTLREILGYCWHIVLGYWIFLAEHIVVGFFWKTHFEGRSLNTMVDAIKELVNTWFSGLEIEWGGNNVRGPQIPQSKGSEHKRRGNSDILFLSRLIVKRHELFELFVCIRKVTTWAECPFSEKNREGSVW